MMKNYNIELKIFLVTYNNLHHLQSYNNLMLYMPHYLLKLFQSLHLKLKLIYDYMVEDFQ